MERADMSDFMSISTNRTPRNLFTDQAVMLIPAMGDGKNIFKHQLRNGLPSSEWRLLNFLRTVIGISAHSVLLGIHQSQLGLAFARQKKSTCGTNTYAADGNARHL